MPKVRIASMVSGIDRSKFKGKGTQHIVRVHLYGPKANTGLYRIGMKLKFSNDSRSLFYDRRK